MKARSLWGSEQIEKGLIAKYYRVYQLFCPPAQKCHWRGRSRVSGGRRPTARLESWTRRYVFVAEGEGFEPSTPILLGVSA